VNGKCTSRKNFARCRAYLQLYFWGPLLAPFFIQSPVSFWVGKRDRLAGNAANSVARSVPVAVIGRTAAAGATTPLHALGVLGGVRWE
jgi:hypothetical protein